MSNIIRLLPDHVANQIAAGEVVQRPSSVVKELVENAVDAGATEIKIILKEAGKTLIQVIDNGKGMGELDARMAFERHATSKITCAEDLFALKTKGFRGEALASIAAVAHVDLKTRQEGQELGVNIVIEGSKVISQEATVVPVGTVFSVKNLFFNIPARRNFLKSTTVEFRHVVDEFERVALVHHNIQFVLIHNGSEVYSLPSTNLRQRIVNIFGVRTNEKLVPVNEETDILKVVGFIGKPEYAKKSRGEQFFFVNDRFIKSGYLHHALVAAYEGLLKEGTHPSYFVYLTLPPDSIDINIHPTKTEVKFDDEQALYSILRATIKHSLGQFNVAPVLDFQRESKFDVPYDYKDKKAATPTIEIDTFYNPFESSILEGLNTGFNPFDAAVEDVENRVSAIESSLYNEAEQHSTKVKVFDTKPAVDNSKQEEVVEYFESKLASTPSVPEEEYFESKGTSLDLQNDIMPSKFNDFESSDTTFESKFNINDTRIDTNEEQVFSSKSNGTSSSKKTGRNAGNTFSSKTNSEGWEQLYKDLKTESNTIDISGLNIESDIVNSTLFDTDADKVVGTKSFQIHRKYIVSPIKSGMLVIDQGRAHQRILYENFMDNITHHKASSQQLLFPLTLYYAPYEIELFRQMLPALEHTGFGFERFGEDFLVISGLPVHVAESEASIVLEDLIADFQDGVPDSLNGLGTRVAKSLALSLAVKTGTILNETEQENIVNSLFACKEPNVSPYMKPTFITMRLEDIDKKFAL